MALSANIGVRNSVGFFTCDEFCRICHNCDGFLRALYLLRFCINNLKGDPLGT